MKTAPAFFGLFLLAATSSFAVTAAPGYTITDLSVRSRMNTPTGINEAGQVAGYLYRYSDDDNSSSSSAFLLSGKSTIPLGSLGGFQNYTGGINNRSQIAGRSNNRAVLYAGGSITDLGTLGGDESFASAINDSGQIVGSSEISPIYNLTHAFLYSGGSMVDLGTLGGSSSYASGINASGQVSGYYFAVFGGYRAFLYSGGALSDLGTLGGTESSANDINDQGQIVGYSATSGDAATHAFLWQSQKMKDLGTLGGLDSSATAINNHGEIVGVSDIKKSQQTHAFLFSKGRMIDLNSTLPPGSKWTLTAANALNDAGQIVGVGTVHGDQHAFLLTPLPSIAVAGGKVRTTSGSHPYIRGTANAIVHKVTYRIGTKGPYKAALGTAKWRFRSNLRHGQNVISIIAHGRDGKSAIARITVTRI